MSRCHKCHKPIRFVKRDRKLWPVNPDGSNHFDGCAADYARMAQERGTAFDDRRGEGFEHQGRKVYMRHHGVVVAAADLSLPSCDCKSPPWEECEHTQAVESA